MKRLISIAVSISILIVLYARIDLQSLQAIFRNSNGIWLAFSLGMVVPITLFTAQRLQILVPLQVNLGLWEANKLILAASVLNMVLPSKMGDIAKAYFMRDRGHLSGSLSLSIVVFEKACDMESLLLWCTFGLLVYPERNILFDIMTWAVIAGLILGILLLGSRRFARIVFGNARKISPKIIEQKLTNLQVSWNEMQDYILSDWQQLTKVALASIFIWFLHLLQIWFFILALRAWIPFWVNLALSPLAILAGLLPLTFAGVGTRDAALIAFYQPYFSAATGAALGILCTSRYFLPAVIGLPFLSQYLSNLKSLKRQSL
jgi:uncharacterized protein (TIRG00374 family)